MSFWVFENFEYGFLANYCNCIDNFFIKTVIILILIEIWLLLA
jgi:hypothetical protein